MDYRKFPFVGTKIKGLRQKFDLSDPKERKKYFNAKIGQEIRLLKKYFKKNTFISYLLGKKGAGKGTYTKLMMEIFGNDVIGHVSVGDLVRAVSEELKDRPQQKKFINYLNENYRGYISVKESLDALNSRSTQTLLPNEFILALLKRKIDEMPKKTLFIDGFPRDLDQVSYSLFFRNLIDYRDDADIFVAIDIPESIIDMRMRNRVVCPKCHTPRSLKLLTTKKVGYDKKKKEFYLICDNPECGEARMIGKEGDSAGIESIRERLNLDAKLMEKVFSLHGVPKILLRNAVPVSLAKRYIDDYELTPEFSYCLNRQDRVETAQKPWIVQDDSGRKVYSLMAPAVVTLLIKQLADILKLKND